jgi:anti-sigma B factor antagonist
MPHPREPEIPVLHLRGAVDVDSVKPFVADATAHLRAGRSELVIDLSELDDVSGGALGALLVLECDAELRGGSIRLACVSEPIQRVLRAHGFTEVFESHPSTAEAVRSFGVNRRRTAAA